MSQKKQFLREKIWSEMERLGVAVFPLPCKGRIPNFVGAEVAAQRLQTLKEWNESHVVFVNPDSPQRKVRENALRDGKTLIMASPRLKKGLILVNPAEVKGKERLASTIKGALRFGVKVQDFPKPDMVIEGSVAVDLYGHRLGKGHGYGDAEIQMIRRKFDEVVVATTVHDMQIVEIVPFDVKDEKVSIIVTPARIVRVLS